MWSVRLAKTGRARNRPSRSVAAARQLHGYQRPVRVAAGWSVPADGGVGTRRAHARAWSWYRDFSARGVGPLIFIGFDSLDGYGTFSLSRSEPAGLLPPGRGGVRLGPCRRLAAVLVWWVIRRVDC